MKFTNVQNRYINNKSMGYSFIKGKRCSGKTYTSVLRAINLENNNCIYNEDRILFLCKREDTLKKAKLFYEKNKDSNKFYSLFSNEKKRVEFSLITEIVELYSLNYKKENKLTYNLATYEEGLTILKDQEFVEKLSEYKNKSKILNKITLDELYNEILWIKRCNFNKEEYLNSIRKGRSKRINRNTRTREYIYSLHDIYNSLLKLYGFIDEEDNIKFAIEQIIRKNESYSHIIVDDASNFTKGELDLVKSLYKKKNYTSCIFILDTEISKTNKDFLYNGRKLKELIKNEEYKTFAFRTIFEDNKQEKLEFISKYKYVNFKNRITSNFKIDESISNKEIFLDDSVVFKEDELREIRVFSSIAAGDPIEIKDTIENKFFMPSSWLERGKDTFILNVKGDSMIDKDICDGDLVVIKKQQIAYNNDIVAASVDGEATLKILNINGKIPMLMPANKKYKPIIIKDKDVSILGVALGVIKEEN